MMYHTCLNSKYKYLFSIFENFPTMSFKAPLTKCDPHLAHADCGITNVHSR